MQCQVVIVMQATALVLIQIANVLAITMLSAMRRPGNLSPRDVSLVLHDSENAAKGRRRAPRMVVGRLQELLTE